MPGFSPNLVSRLQPLGTCVRCCCEGGPRQMPGRAAEVISTDPPTLPPPQELLVSSLRVLCSVLPSLCYDHCYHAKCYGCCCFISFHVPGSLVPIWLKGFLLLLLPWLWSPPSVPSIAVRADAAAASPCCSPRFDLARRRSFLCETSRNYTPIIYPSWPRFIGMTVLVLHEWHLT